MRHQALLALVMVGLLPAPVSAQVSDPISFEVVNNNRLFKPKAQPAISREHRQTTTEVITEHPTLKPRAQNEEVSSESVRFQEDLQIYLRCADKGGATEDKCRSYRKLGSFDNRLVPNLRSGAPHFEYATHYDKVAMAYEPGYATSALRTLRFSLSSDLLLAATTNRSTCHWTLRAATGETVAEGSPECAARDLQIGLIMNAADRAMSFDGKIEVVIKSGNSADQRYSSRVFTRDYLIVALGDSFTSGEGNPERNVTSDTPAQWLDYRCHRSVFSYPVILAQMLSLTDPRHSVTLLHLACSGARSTIGVTQRYRGVLDREQMGSRWSEFDGWFGPATSFPSKWRKYGTAVEVMEPQVVQATNALKLETGAVRRPDLVVMSVGVNDMGEVPFIKAIAENDYNAQRMTETFARETGQSKSKCFFDSTEPSTNKEQAIDDAKRLKIGFDCLQQRLVALSENLKAALDPRDVYLMEYHDPLQDEDGKTCGSKAEHRELLDDFLGKAALHKRWLGPIFGKGELTKPELEYAHQAFLKPFLSALSQSATKGGWRYINSMGEEHKRGFCSQRRSWYHDYRASRARQGLLPDDDIVSTGTLHPNTFGQYYSAVRSLSRIRTTKLFGRHNISCVTSNAFDAPAEGNPDKTEGLAWYIWNTDHPNEVLAKYHAFRAADSPCGTERGG